MKKILIVITTGFVSCGGLTSVMMNYYKKIDKSKYIIDFASTNMELDDDLKKELEGNNSKYYALGNRKRNLLAYEKNLYNVIKNNSYDIIHVNANSATASFELILAKILKVEKRIVHIHTSICDHRILHKLLSPIFNNLYTDAIACSHKAGSWIFDDGKFTILNNGIDTQRFRFDENSRKLVRRKFNISDDCMLLGHVGKLYKPKNHLFLVDIFKEIHKDNSNTRLLLVGDGEMRPEIEDKVEKLHLKDAVIFAGMQTHVEDFMSAMDYFLFPSLWEGLPLSVIEAQASGLKCLVSDAIDASVCVTDTIEMKSIDSIKPWLICYDKILLSDRIKQSDDNIESIKNVGYDCATNVTKLEQIYDL